MSFDSAYYASQHTDLAEAPVIHYLTTGWAAGHAVNEEREALTPDEVLELIAGTGEDLPEVVAQLEAAQLAYVDEAAGFDLGAVLAGLDDDLLADFMSGWETDEMQYLDGLASFDLDDVLEGFDSDVLMGLMGEWEEEANLEYLAGLDDFDFGALAGANPDELMALFGEMGTEFQESVYEDFDASDFVWLDDAQNFDLAGQIMDDFGFFEEWLTPEEALGLFGSLGSQLDEAVQALDAVDLSFLDSAAGFDLGGFLGDLDDDMLSGFMEGWGTEELSFLDNLQSFDLGEALAGFDADALGDMLEEWNDPSLLGFIDGLEDFNLAEALDSMPGANIGGLLGGWDESMLSMLESLGDGFDTNEWIAGAGNHLPADFDWSGYVPAMPGEDHSLVLPVGTPTITPIA